MTRNWCGETKVSHSRRKNESYVYVIHATTMRECTSFAIHIPIQFLLIKYKKLISYSIAHGNTQNLKRTHTHTHWLSLYTYCIYYHHDHWPHVQLFFPCHFAMHGLQDVFLSLSLPDFFPSADWTCILYFIIYWTSPEMKKKFESIARHLIYFVVAVVVFGALSTCAFSLIFIKMINYRV